MLELNFDVFPILHTPRFVLRRTTVSDAEAMLAMRSDAEVMRYIGRPLMQTVDEAQEFLKKIDGYFWAICSYEDDRLIGSICLWNIEPEHYRAEIGYMLSRAHWEQGVLTEAMQAVIRYGFEDMGLHSIAAIVKPDNAASIKLLNKHGFVKEAHFKENYFFNGVFGDSAVYSLLNK